MIAKRDGTLTPLLLASTKFMPPVLPSRYVPRERLHDALDGAASLPLTVVVGVPGAGKSVVLRSWLQDRPELATVWVSCDARDADPVAFWQGLVTALAQTWPDRWLDLLDVLWEAEPDLDAVAIEVVNELAEIGRPMVLAIDDFHFATAAAPSLTTLIDRLPPSCRVVVASRSEPGIARHRLRAYGQLLELRDADLRLTSAEVAAVMEEFEVELTAPDVDRVALRTEGWMAGVQMVAMSLRDRSDPAEFLAELARAPRAITDFLGAEVLDRQPAEIRDFLLETSILDVFDAASCAAVTQQADAKVLLTHIDDENLFLIELGDGTYRYHHLFADLLRRRLQADDPDRWRAVHARAATCCLDTGDIEGAIGHLLAAGEQAHAFDVLRENIQAAFYQGDGHLPGRLSALVESHATTIDPDRLPDLALAMGASAPAQEAEPWIARASRQSETLDDTGRARLAVACGVVAMQRGDADGIRAAFSSDAGPLEITDAALAANAASVQARSRMWLGDLDGAREICERAILGSDDRSRIQAAMGSGLAWVACVEGRLDEAMTVAEQSLASAEALGLVGHPIMAEALSAQGRVAFERGDLDTAERLLEQAILIGERIRPAFALLAQLSLAKVWWAASRSGEAVRGAAHARAFLPPDSTSPLVDLCEAVQGRLALEIGDLEAAEASVRRLAPGHRGLLLRSRIDLARGALDEAAGALARCAPSTPREQLDVAVLAARIAHCRRAHDADDVLAGCVERAKDQRFVVVVSDDLVELRSQVIALLRSGHVGPFEDAVLERVERGLPLVKSYGGAGSPLSDREVTVARYLASRLTNREIASELYVSTNTLKTHVARIYRKLGVSSRSAAVAEARRLGVL